MRLVAVDAVADVAVWADQVLRCVVGARAEAAQRGFVRVVQGVWGVLAGEVVYADQTGVPVGE